MGLLDWLKGKPATPAATAAKPAAAPAAPASNNAAATAAASTIKRSAPVTAPATPVTAPATPAAAPRTPVAAPTTPAAVPTASTAAPAAAPVVNRTTTVTQPSMAVNPAQPSAPAVSAPYVAPVSATVPNAAPAQVQRVATAPAVMPTGELQVVIGTSPMKFTTGKPYLEGYNVMVPIRELAEHLGAKADWNDKTRTATLSKDNDTVEITIGSLTAKVNGKPIPTGVPPVVRQDRLYMPIQFMAEALEVSYSYDSVKKIATIS